MRRQIVRVEDGQEFGLAHRYVFGLNLFWYNRVPCAIERRPDVVSLTRLTERNACAAQVAALFLKEQVDTPSEMFGAPEGPKAETPYRVTRNVGFYDGFFDLMGGIPFTGRMVDGEWVLDDEPRYGDCFFPRVTLAFWRAVRREEGAWNNCSSVTASPSTWDRPQQMPGRGWYACSTRHFRRRKRSCGPSRTCTP